MARGQGAGREGSESRDRELGLPQGGRKQGCDVTPGQASLAARAGGGGQGAGAPALRTSGMRGQILGENTALREHLSGVHRGVTGMRLQKASDQRWESRPQGWRSRRGRVHTGECTDGHGGRSIRAEANF